MLCARLPLVALIVRVKLPVAVLRVVLTVRVDEPDLFKEEGAKLAVPRFGVPVTLKLTIPVKPLPAVRVMV